MTSIEPVTPASCLTRDTRRQAARILAQAFTADPVWAELKPRRETRAHRALYWVFRGEITIAAVLGGYVAMTFDSQHNVSAVAIAYIRRRPRGFPWWTAFLRIPAIVLLGVSRTFQSARMGLAAEAHQPDYPHIYAYYAGSTTLGGGTVLVRRLMKMAAREHLPIYSEAKSAEMLEMLRILHWRIAAPIDIGYGRQLIPVDWAPPGLDAGMYQPIPRTSVRRIGQR
ncbi:hypothetical protein ACFVUS_24765 [Nocardia sp. NPDC058058]|uniref:hypothetical protein n=1 Tax=Nocardia sp. NPDC058058 TaxID=3346317 RepID=UPI0036DA6972